MDIIGHVIWKLSLASAFFAALACVVFRYHRAGGPDISPASFVETMKRAGLYGGLTVRVDAWTRDYTEPGGVFIIRAIRGLDDRFGLVKAAAYRIEWFMKGINRGMATRGGPLHGKEFMEALNDMTRQR